MPKEPHSEIVWLPRATSPKGEKWFALIEPGYTQGECRERFAKGAGEDWSVLKKEGWRIVKVRISEFPG